MRRRRALPAILTCSGWAHMQQQSNNTCCCIFMCLSSLPTPGAGLRPPGYGSLRTACVTMACCSTGTRRSGARRTAARPTHSARSHTTANITSGESPAMRRCRGTVDLHSRPPDVTGPSCPRCQPVAGGVQAAAAGACCYLPGCLPPRINQSRAQIPFCCPPPTSTQRIPLCS